MSWLKKVGQIVAKVGQAVGVLGPIATQLYPKTSGAIGQTLDIASGIANAVVHAEVLLAAKPGPERLLAVAPITIDLVRASNLIDGKKIKDEALFARGCTKMTDGMADILNSLEAPVA